MAERPVECSLCQKKLEVIYKEIVNQHISCVEMCSDCPVLARKLHGDIESELPSAKNLQDLPPGLACGNCMTTLEGVKMGHPLGCSNCYNVFEEELAKELLADKKTTKISHIGKVPHKPISFPSSTEIPILNQALDEALKQENYEHAAWLRDQIKEIMEKPGERENKSP
jgi:protein arginine kinase activator